MKIKKNLAQFCVVYAVFGIIVGLFILAVGRAEDPVAKVHLRGILSQHELFQDGPARRVAWVDILEVYDKATFEKKALKISKDGQRANLGERIVGERAEDGVYYMYDNTQTLESSKRSNFWQNLFIWFCATTVFSLLKIKL